MTEKEFFVPFKLHSPGELATERIEQFLRHSAALQLPGMERPEASHGDPREPGSGSVGNTVIAFYVRGAPHPASEQHFLRKALLRPARSHPVSLRISLLQKPLIHSVQRPDSR
jgi:hypothetical protein